MKFEGTRAWGFLNAAIGMRLPMSKDFEDAKSKSDSLVTETQDDDYIGEKDLVLMQKLLKEDKLGGGQPNSKFMRMIHVQVAITAPLCWWKEFDTYKVGTTANSTSTMHKIHNYPIDKTCFEPNPIAGMCAVSQNTIDELELMRKMVNCESSADMVRKSIWYVLIYNLPDSWLQTRMVDFDYATIRNMVIWRKNHKQNCWSGLDNPHMDNFIKWAKTLPYAEELLFN